jgi:hypothetical protein
MAHVFISYVRDNASQVDRLCAALTASGVRVWVDKYAITPGARWRDAIRDAIRSGDYFIACFSAEYRARAKTYMNEELKLAMDELRQSSADRTWFIPVLLSECEVPARSIGAGQTLLDINSVPLYADWDGGIRRIVSVIDPTPAEIQRYIEALHSADAEIRRNAARALGNDTHPSAVFELRRTLADSDNLVQSETIDALLKYGKQGVNALVDAVCTDRGKSPAQLILALVSRVAVGQNKRASKALTSVYKSGAAEKRALIYDSITQLKRDYEAERDAKMSEYAMFEGFMGTFPAKEERALQAFDDLLQRLEDIKGD